MVRVFSYIIFIFNTIATLHWNDLTITKNSKNAFLLQPSTGSLPDGALLGIIGPSGSGKTTFLRTLSNNSYLSNSLRIGGSCSSFPAAGVAFLSQSDNFFDALTVGETVAVNAVLQDCEHVDTAELTNLLGMTKLEDRRVGKDLSGGERRRLSLLLAIMGPLELLLADEPTSGLDSSQSLNVVRLLKSVGRERQVPVVCTLHQPRQRIFDELDYVMVLASKGRCVYVGKADRAVAYFKSVGHRADPPNLPVAEFLIDLVSENQADADQGAQDELRIQELSRAWSMRKKNESGNENEIASALASHQEQARRRHPFRIFCCLVSRSWRQNLRETQVNVLRTISSGGLAYFFSILFKDSIGPPPRTKNDGKLNAESLADRTALLSYSVLTTAMMSLMKSLSLFGKERPVVERERKRDQYSGANYLLAKTCAELPLDCAFTALFSCVLLKKVNLNLSLVELTSGLIGVTTSAALMGFAVGSWFEADAAFAVGCPLLLVSMCVGIINPSGVVKNKNKNENDAASKRKGIIDVLKLCSPISWAVAGLVFAEFNDCEISRPSLRSLPRMGAFAAIRNGRQVLSALGIGEGQNFVASLKAMGAISFSHLAIAFLGLRSGRSSRISNTNKNNNNNIFL